jgi:hypothetical protein
MSRTLTAQYRSALIRVAHENPQLRPQLLPLLQAREASSMHVNDYFDVWKATDGQWYGQAMAYDVPYEDADEDDDDADYGYIADGPAHGPFDSQEDASRYLLRKYANRGDDVDPSGRRPPPKNPRK